MANSIGSEMTLRSVDDSRDDPKLAPPLTLLDERPRAQTLLTFLAGDRGFDFVVDLP